MSRQLISPDDTVPCKVNYEQRKATDVIGGAINILSYLAFIITGIIVTVRSAPRHQIFEDGTRGLSEYYMDDAATCCGNHGDDGYACVLYEATLAQSSGGGGGRRLAAGSSKFDGDEGIFDAFAEAPGIIIGLLSIVMVVAVIWVVLLRYFAKPIVILVEVAKVALMITVGVMQENVEGKVIFFVIAAAMIAYAIYCKDAILFAAKIITHSTISMKENPSILAGSLVMKLVYAGNAALFVLFFSKSFNVVTISHHSEFTDDTYGWGCDFYYPRYVRSINIYHSLSYLWTLLLLDQMRLSVVATIVGSWHFHPEDKPGLMRALLNVIPSFGTLSISSLIATIAEKVCRMMGEKAWLTPFICLTFPFHCLMCLIGQCIRGCVQMLTNFAVVLHVFTGQNFFGSAKKSFQILSRHFEGGFVTDYTSRSLFAIASYTFSFCVALITWAWIDAEFNAGSLPDRFMSQQMLFILVVIFNLYYPVLGLYAMIFVNNILRDFERQKMLKSLNSNGVDDGSAYYFNENSNHLWIPPLAATFVGCISMMFFTFLSSIFLDIITTLFLCFAIDKDNNVDLTDTEFEALAKESPNYIDCEVQTAPSATSPDYDDPEDGVAVAIPVKTH